MQDNNIVGALALVALLAAMIIGTASYKLGYMQSRDDNIQPVSSRIQIDVTKDETISIKLDNRAITIKVN